jgi:hypothetical protein
MLLGSCQNATTDVWPDALPSLARLVAIARQEGTMIASHATAHAIENAKVALILIAVGIVFFWRVLLRVLLAIIVVAVGTGVLVLLHSMHQ